MFQLTVQITLQYFNNPKQFVLSLYVILFAGAFLWIQYLLHITLLVRFHLFMINIQCFNPKHLDGVRGERVVISILSIYDFVLDLTITQNPLPIINLQCVNM